MLCAVGDFGDGIFSLPQKPDSSTNVQLTTIAPIAQNTCYGLPLFHDNALGGHCKTHINKMAKFRKKPVVIEAITFDELVKHGLENGANVNNGMPWSWNYKGIPITYENDQCYLIPTLEGTHNMTPDDMLITGVKGEIYPCKIDIFEATYEKVED